jgi:NitT/TauT family transport system permease protein
VSGKTRFGLLEIMPFMIVLGSWFLLVHSRAIDPVFLPQPQATFRSFVELFSRQFFLDHLVPSALRVSFAFCLSVLIAFPLGLFTSQVPLLARLVHPLCGFTRYLPVAAFVPLCILWFGIGDEQKIAVITIGVVFQLVLLIAYDASSVPMELIEAGRTFGLSPFKIIVRIVCPAAMPAIWDHLRISAGWAWSYVVLAELVAGNRGLGYFIVQSQRYLETDRVFAGILFIGALGAITDWAFKRAASRMFRWA